MTDKEKIREEVEKLHGNPYYMMAVKDVLEILDMQEEPVSEDLELTWEDMMLIHKCIKDAMNYHLYKMIEGAEGQKVVYQEVLKRFKDYGEKKIF